MGTPRIPPYHRFMWPALQATKASGGSATVREMNDWVIASEGYSEAEQAVPHGDGRMSEIEYRLHWARTHLKGIGALSNSARGVWTVTDHGKQITEEQMYAETKAWRTQLRLRRKARAALPASEGDETGADLELPGPEPADLELPGTEDVEVGWEEDLIACLLNLSSNGFERLAQRLLREAGFINVRVTGKSGDGGIDGVGLYRPSLVSFPIYFQCKRFRGAVTAGAVRDFRGAMSGRGEKGLLITTGSFTKDALSEASRDGAPAIELIDGERLCELLKQYALGVRVTQRIEEDVAVEPEFFKEFMD